MKGEQIKSFNEVKSPYKWPETPMPLSHVNGLCSSTLGIHANHLNSLLDSWLQEDHGSGDASVWCHPAPLSHVEGFVVCKSSMVLCGLWLLAATFYRCGATEVFFNQSEGQSLSPGEVLLGVRGQLSSVLLGERVALNICARLSGIATYTSDKVHSLKALNPRGPLLLETRKTTPGWRILEKYATRVGGARNHRHGLDSGVMLKENHMRCSPLSGPETIAYVSQKSPILLRTEVEVGNLTEFDLALESSAQVIMLDNFNYEDVLFAVEKRNRFYPQKLIEISGNLDKWPLEHLANCGVDFASMGSLIYKAPWVDISLQIYKMNGDL